MTAHGLVAPTHRSIRKYYEQVAALRDQRVLNEMSVRSAFEFLLADTAKLKGWTFIPELSGKSGGALIRPDGTLRDRNSLPRGYWEAKDTQDNFPSEIKKKIARGYPLSNIIFEDTQTGVLFQNKQQINGNLISAIPRNWRRCSTSSSPIPSRTSKVLRKRLTSLRNACPTWRAGLVERIQQAHKDNSALSGGLREVL